MSRTIAYLSCLNLETLYHWSRAIPVVIKGPCLAHVFNTRLPRTRSGSRLCATPGVRGVFAMSLSGLGAQAVERCSFYQARRYPA